MKLLTTVIFCFCLSQITFAKINPAKDSVSKSEKQPDTDSVIKDYFPEEATTEDQNYITVLYQNNEDFFLPSLSKMKLWGFQPRGVSLHKRKILVSNLEWNLPETGAIPFLDLSILYGNCVSKSTSGLAISPLHPGGINGISSFTINPLLRQKTYHAGFLFSNENTRHIFRTRYTSGISNNGWATTIGFTQKWSDEGYSPGTFIRSSAFVASIGKRFSKLGDFTLSVLGNNVQRAYSASITEETATLANYFQYNPNWGWQSGEKRNSHTLHSFQPVAILQYRHQPNPQTEWGIALSYQSGTEGYTTLDWFHAPNPRSDYYKNLPSYYYLQGGKQNRETGDYLTEKWQQQPFQLDWAALYDANRANAYSSISGAMQPALYVLAEDKQAIHLWRSAIHLNHSFNEHIYFTGGFQYLHSRTENYRELKDLLGGNFYVNLNQFAFQSYGQASGWEQYDLKQPNRKIHEGEKYYYNYISEAQKGFFWGNGYFQYHKFHAFFSAKIVATGYQRIGKYKNGVFPNDSYGVSAAPVFLSYQSKAGFRYQFGQGQKLWLSLMAGKQSPTFEQTFFNPRIRNTQTEKLKQPTRYALEIGGQIKNEKWKTQLSLFSSETKNQTDVLAFYHDDYRTFVHMILQGINTVHTGIELAGSVSPVSFLTIDFLAGWMQSFYRSRPQISLVRDNDTALILSDQTVYWKNRYALTGPQSVLGLTLHFHTKRLGYMNIYGTMQNRNFVGLNPLRYTEEAVYLLPEGESKRALILDQEKLPACFLLSLNIGRTFNFPNNNSGFLRKSRWRLSGGIQNILNHTSYARFGSEQLRFDFNTQNPMQFPNKYVYGPGRTFYLSIQYYGW